jgi:hypothetical protein
VPARGRRAWGHASARPVLAVALVAASALALAVAAASPTTVHAVGARPAPTPAALRAPAAPGRLLADLDSDGPWSSGALDAGGRTVVLSSVCRGSGTYDVRIGDAAATTLVCDWGGPAYAMLSSDRPLHRFAVTVTATPGQITPSWSVSVGTLPAGTG